ncbi:MAG: patatin-like phospholipase family protein [Clostridia bacterium]
MKIGVALSGGGIRGAAHIGVLRAFEEAGIPIHMISGTSSGSIVASLYASGYTPREIERIFLKFGNEDIADPDWGKTMPFMIDLMLFKRSREREHLDLIDFDYLGVMVFILNWIFRREGKIDGFIKGDALENIVKKCCADKGIIILSQTVIPLAIPAVDINTAQTVMFTSDKSLFKDTRDTIYIDDAEIWDAVRASAGFPVVFKPKMFRGRRLVDGGVTDNVPTKVLKSMGADKVVAVNLGYSGQSKEEIDNVFEIAAQSIDVMAYHLSKITVADADYVIKPEIYDVKLLETSRIRECIQRGYIQTNLAMPEIRRKLGLSNSYIKSV